MSAKARVAVAVLVGILLTLVDWMIPQFGTAGVALALYNFGCIPLVLGLCCLPLRSYHQVGYVVVVGCLCAKSSDSLIRFRMIPVVNAVEFILQVAYTVFVLSCIVYVRNGFWPIYIRGTCKRCGYNLTANVSGICPECGDPY